MSREVDHELVASSPTGRGGHPEAGFTLVEVLVAVVILGIAAAGIIPAVQGLVISSQDHRGMASADAVLRSYGEAFAERATDTSVLCPTMSDITPTASEFSVSGWSVWPAGVSTAATPPAPDYWIPAADFRTGSWGDRSACLAYAASTCPSLSPRPAECDGGLVRVKVTVKSTADSPSHSTPQASTELLLRRGVS